MRWFGEPWPSAELRAGVCEDDSERVDVPVGAPCAECTFVFQADDRGVVIPYLGSERDDVEDSYWHLRCILLTTVGPAMADDVLAQMEA